MDLQLISFLCCCLCPYLANAGGVIVIHYEEEMKKILAEFNISEPTQEQKSFASKILDERVEKRRMELEHRAELEKEKERADRHEKNLTDAYERIGILRSEKEIARTDLLIKDTALGYRSTIEELEALVFPDWLFGTKLSRKQRWIIALALPISKYAIQIQNKLRQGGITPTEGTIAFEKFYMKLSGKEGHNKDSPRIPETDAEWEKLYEFFNARHDFEKVTLKVSLGSLELMKEEKSTETLEGPTHRYFILLGNVNHKAQEKNVRQVLEPLKLENLYIHMVTKYKGLPSGYVAMVFTSKEYKSLEEIHSELKSRKTFPFDNPNMYVNVYTETEGVEETQFLEKAEESTTSNRPS